MRLYSLGLHLQCSRYNDIAKYGFFAIEKHVTSSSESSVEKDTTAGEKATDIEGYVYAQTSSHTTCGFRAENHLLHSFLCSVMIKLAEQAYSVLLLNFFFLEVI